MWGQAAHGLWVYLNFEKVQQTNIMTRFCPSNYVNKQIDMTATHSLFQKEKITFSPWKLPNMTEYNATQNNLSLHEFIVFWIENKNDMKKIWKPK